MPILFDLHLLLNCLAHFSCLIPYNSTQMSIRRHVVIKTYEDMLSELYDGNVSNSSGGYLREEVDVA